MKKHINKWKHVQLLITADFSNKHKMDDEKRKSAFNEKTK